MCGTTAMLNKASCHSVNTIMSVKGKSSAFHQREPRDEALLRISQSNEITKITCAAQSPQNMVPRVTDRRVGGPSVVLCSILLGVKIRTRKP